MCHTFSTLHNPHADMQKTDHHDRENQRETRYSPEACDEWYAMNPSETNGRQHTSKEDNHQTDATASILMTTKITDSHTQNESNDPYQ